LGNRIIKEIEISNEDMKLFLNLSDDKISEIKKLKNVDKFIEKMIP